MEVLFEESIYFKFRPAWKAFFVYILGAIVFFMGPLINPQAYINPFVSNLIFICFIVFIFIVKYNNLYGVKREVLWKKKFFWKKSFEEVLVQDIKRIDLRRGLVQRILNVAHIHVYVDLDEEPIIKLFGILNPEQFKIFLKKLGAKDQVVTGAWRR